MKYSRTAIKILKARYLSVLKKCALINAGLFFLAAPASAAVNVTDFDDFMTKWKNTSGTDGEFNLTQDLNVTEDINAPGFAPTTINGNGHNINGNGNKGIIADSNQTLNIGDINNPQKITFTNFFRRNEGDGSGGAIQNKGQIGFISGVFKNNTAGGGGAIHNNGGLIDTIIGNFIENQAWFGGAIYNYQGTINHISGNFINNRAVSDANSFSGAIHNEGDIGSIDGVFKGNTSNREGGVLENRKIIKSLSGEFYGNHAGTRGGAIHNIGNYINIVADKSDTIFTGNSAAGVSNALYNGYGSVTNLNAGEAKIVFNDGIDGSRGTININNAGVKMADSKTNASTHGVVEFNNLVSGNAVNLYNGTLKLGSYAGGTVLGKEVAASKGNFADDVDFIAHGGLLDITNNQVVAHSVEFKTGSTLALTIDSLDKPASLTANNITIGNADLKMTVAPGVIKDKTPQNVTLLSQNSGTFSDNFTLLNNNSMFSFKKGNKAGDYVITLENTASEAAIKSGATKNNGNTISAWVDGGFVQGSKEESLSARLYDMAQHNAGELSPVLTALAPEVSPVVRAQTSEHTNQIFNAASSRMSGGVINSAAEGMASGDSLLDGGATWVQLLANKTDFDGNSQVHGFDSKSTGVAMGAEKQVSATTKLGVGYGYTNGEIDAFLRDIDVDTHTVFAYGEYKPSKWFINGIASYSFADYDEHKNVAGSGYKAKYNVESFGLQAMIGYDTMLGKTQFTPTAGLRYNHIKRDGYTDSLNQHVSGDNMDILTAVIGAKFYKDFRTCGGTWWRPEFRLAATYDLISDEENAVVGLSNGSGYMVEGERLDRFGIETGVGLTVDVSDKLETSVGYEGKFRENYTDHTGILFAKYKF